MKLNRKDLLRLLLEQDCNEEIDVTSIMPKEKKESYIDSNPFVKEFFEEEEASWLNQRKENYRETARQIKEILPNGSSEKPSKMAPSSLFSDEPVKESSNKELPSYVQQMLDDGSITDPRYAQVLAGNVSYMEYLKSNPKLFLHKRIEWKYNKIVAYRGFGKGYYKDYYRTNFVDLCSNERGKAFIGLCKEYYGDDLVLTGKPVLDIIECMYKFNPNINKIIYAMVRPDNFESYKQSNYKSFNRSDIVFVPNNISCMIVDDYDELLSILVEHSRDSIVAEKICTMLSSIDKGMFKDITVTYLVDPNYKVRVEFDKCKRKISNLWKWRGNLDIALRHNLEDQIQMSKYRICKIVGLEAYKDNVPYSVENLITIVEEESARLSKELDYYGKKMRE